MTSRLFRKKPITIEAFRVGIDQVPTWAKEKEHVKIFQNGPDSYAEVHTLEGVMRCYFGDYIIKGAYGELYPCRADVFEDTYVPNDEECEDSIYRTILHKLYSLMYHNKEEELSKTLNIIFEWGSVCENREMTISEIKSASHSVIKKATKI